MLPAGSLNQAIRRTIPAHDPFHIGLQIALVIMLKFDAALAQLVDRTIDIVHRKIQHGERRRNVIGLWINEDVIAAAQVQSKQAMVLRRFQSERLAVELFLLRDIQCRESTECFAVFQHDILSPKCLRLASRIWFPNVIF